MTFIVAFQEEFCQKLQTIYYVNKDTQGTHGSSVITSEKCPHCEERNVFKVFEPKSFREDETFVTDIYDCKCPTCREEFNLEIEFEI